MKILLVNNYTEYLNSLNESLAGHDVQIQTYKPGVRFRYQDKDLVILSGGGGEGLEIHDEFKRGKLWHEDQMKFVLTCPKPIIGICMGFEVICRAYGANIKKLDKIVKGFVEVKANEAGTEIFGKKNLKQFESHEWSVPKINSFCLEVLAESSTGVEAIKHKTRPMIATQFHPEKGGTLKLADLL